MGRISRSSVAALLATLLLGCGYFVSGTWEDDPKNWPRAFGEPLPEGGEVVHSRYTRYPHFTHEHLFHIRFRAERAFLDEMISRYGLVEVKVPGERPQWLGENLEDPEWFVPGPIANYEAWRGMGTLRNAELSIDGETGEAHFTHMQL